MKEDAMTIRKKVIVYNFFENDRSLKMFKTTNSAFTFSVSCLSTNTAAFNVKPYLKKEILRIMSRHYLHTWL